MKYGTAHAMQSGAEAAEIPAIFTKLWLYTNFDCNLRCSYCVAESTPETPRRALGFSNMKRLVDEAVPLGFTDVFLTGGEPFLLEEIDRMLAYASARIHTTVLTNGVLLRGKQLEQLCAIKNENMTIQVSLDGAKPEHNDPYRGSGTWARAVTTIRQLLARGLRVTISTTETPANTDHLDELQGFLVGLGVPVADHLVRPLAKRGFSDEGLTINIDTLVPEPTVDIDGVSWHPLHAPSDESMLISREIFPLANALKCIAERLGSQTCGNGSSRQEFT